MPADGSVWILQIIQNITMLLMEVKKLEFTLVACVLESTILKKIENYYLKKFVLASDHAGYNLKEFIKKSLILVKTFQ